MIPHSTLPYIIIAFLLSVVLHEVAHGWMAEKLGDPTARLKGRITLNPLPHIDILWTILLPAFLLLARSPIIFGAAKPVPINAFNLRNPKRDMMLIGAAGPVTNIVIASAAILLFRFLKNSDFVPRYVLAFLAILVLINVVLAFFNLIPIPPLDGSHILVGLLPYKLALRIEMAKGYGFILLMLLIFPIFGGRSALSYIIKPLMDLTLKLLYY